jgi:hypothetical protein
MGRSLQNHDQVALCKVRGDRHPRNTHQCLATMGKVETRHVAESGQAHVTRLRKARAEIERTTERKASEDVAEQVQRGEVSISNFMLVQLIGRSRRNSGLPGIQTTDHLG